MRKLLVGLALLFVVLPVQPQEQVAAPSIDVFQRFDGTVNLRAPKGPPITARVQVHNWGIRNGQTVTSFPLQGLLVMELHGGELTTVIDGARTEREPGAFWLVPERASLTLITGHDTATLQVTAIQGATP